MAGDPLQFGFQKGSSTGQCTWTILETISPFLREGSNFYVCLLDFSKASDKVNFFQLFKKLIDRRIPFIFLRLLLYIYGMQKCCVKWNNIKNSFFTVKNGVRQGAVVSPTFSCIYLDTLLGSLRKGGVGCYLGGTFMGAFSYADDVTLLAPTRHSLQILLKICEEFAHTHQMHFSTLTLQKAKQSVYFSQEIKVNLGQWR